MAGEWESLGVVWEEEVWFWSTPGSDNRTNHSTYFTHFCAGSLVLDLEVGGKSGLKKMDRPIMGANFRREWCPQPNTGQGTFMMPLSCTQAGVPLRAARGRKISTGFKTEGDRGGNNPRLIVWTVRQPWKEYRGDYIYTAINITQEIIKARKALHDMSS